jgi:dTDP-4-dehydrorhamnose reductase
MEETSQMKILITGGSGLLGQVLMNIFKDQEIYGTYYQHLGAQEKLLYLDITSEKEVKHLFEKIKPRMVIHTAAMTNVDDCEVHPQKAMQINGEGTRNLVSAASQIGAKFVYLSTDYVFDGKKGRYTEEDPEAPINVYGESKLAGEHIVQQGCRDFLIARASVLYGSAKRNFATWILSQLAQQKQLSIIDDQYASPTYNRDLAGQLKALIQNDAQGIFHTAGGERMNRFQFALRIADVFGYDTASIKPVDISTLAWIAKRPHDSSLDISKITPIKKPYKVQQALGELYDELRGS